MPIYEYECKSCKKVIEVLQRISDEPLVSCPECSGSVQKMVSMSSFQLKGGGWYADGYSTTSGGGAGKASSASSASAADSGSSASAGDSASSSAGCAASCGGGACASASA